MVKIDKALFERAGYSLGMSRLVKDMQYADYTKSLQQDLNNIKTYNKEKGEENPYGLPIEKMGRNERARSTQYIVGLADQVKQLGRITEGRNFIDSNTGEKRKATKEDVENARNQMDKLDLQIKNHSDHLETKAQLTANLRNRGISESATLEQKKNYELIQNNAQEQRFNEETNEYEWFDHTVGKFVPISKFNTGSAYNDTLEKTINETYSKVREMSTQLKYQRNPDNFKAINANIMSEMQTLIEKDPNAVKNLLFERKNDPNVKMLLDNYMEKYYTQYLDNSNYPDAAAAMEKFGINSFEDYKNSSLYDADLNKFKQEGEIDNQLFLDSFESMVNNEFEKYLPEPEPEEKKTVVKRKTTKEKQGDFEETPIDESTSPEDIIKNVLNKTDEKEEEKSEVKPFDFNSLNKEEATKYILDNLDKYDLTESTIEAIKKGERPLNRLQDIHKTYLIK